MQKKSVQLMFAASMLLLCCGCVISNSERQDSAMLATEEACRNQPAWEKRGQRVAPIVSKTVVFPTGKEQKK